MRRLVTYWISMKENVPEDTTMCVFHVKRRIADHISFGGYSSTLPGFYDMVIGLWYDNSKVDYWMPILTLPKKERIDD